ncbi:MAG TPA: hypothetical protein EYQ86_05390 [Bacteroidetes bacterium]|nr:hypothetical protein [Bacteroidota bacterium]
MSRKAKIDNANKLINIVATLLEGQERLLQHIGDLEEYIEVLENLNEFEEGEEFIMFTPDEDFKDILDSGLTKDQKERLSQIKKEKEKPEPQSLHSMDDILSMFDEEGKDE